MSLLENISHDRALGSHLLFGHKHKDESPPFHVQMMDLWRAQDAFVCIQAFRSAAKTTLAEEFLLMEAAFGNFKYCLIFGETYTKACQRIETIKHEINTNSKLSAIFGNLKGTVWSENRIILSNGALIEAHGWEEEIRGYKHRDARPDRAYLDDIENLTSVRSMEAVEAGWAKIHLQLIPAMDKDGKIRMTGTPLADDCLVRRAEVSPDWVSAKFPICDLDPTDPQAQALWASRFPMDWIREKRAAFERAGRLREFNQEYMLMPAGAMGKPFEESMIHFVDMAPATYMPRKVIMDPARTVDLSKSDQTGHVTVGKLGSKVYIFDSGGEYWKPDEIVNAAFSLSHKHDDAEVYIEKNSLDLWMTQPIRAKSLATGQHLELTAMNAPQDRDKAQFITGLVPYFTAGDIVLVGPSSSHAKLKAQILNFPSGKRDILNALAYIQRVFAGYPVYQDFGQENIASGCVLGRNDALLLGCNSTGGETCAALIAVNGRNMTVLADWVSPLTPNEAIPDICHLVRAVYPGRHITAWVPGEIHDQQGRHPLISALNSCRLKPSRGEMSAVSRGSLSPAIRTGMNGRRMLLVSDNARLTLNALSDGYHYPVKSGGERMPEPQRNSARTLIEALECLTMAVNKPENVQLGGSPNAVNSTGTPYLSALPRR